MAVKRFLREDEKIINFSNTTSTFVDSWDTAISLHKVKSSDEKSIGDTRSHLAFSEYIKKEQELARKHHPWRRQYLDSLTLIHRQLYDFESLLIDLVEHGSEDGAIEVEDGGIGGNFVGVTPIDTGPLWGLAYLNVKLAIESRTKLKCTLQWMTALRRNIELLNSVVNTCREQHFSDDNNLRMQLMEVFDPLIEMLHSSIDYLQTHYEDDEFRKGWVNFEAGIKLNNETLFHTMSHLREVMTTSKTNLAAQTQMAVDTNNVRLRNPAAPTEKDIFPVEILPHARAEHFVGRDQDLQRIHAVLGTEADNTLKTFTIYGRRGVGKTQLALEYARTQKATYDAIFWVQCETRASLRLSFTAIGEALAEVLDLDLNTQNINAFDETTMRVLRWLKHTQKRWLLIFDNAEREGAEQLHQYLPKGSKGSMLLTSRSYYNFFDDPARQGETVLPFTLEESKQLLLRNLGDDWQAYHLSQDDMMHHMEEKAIELLLEKTRGLPIAIFQAAKLIRDENIGGDQTARGFIEKFNLSMKNLPKRQLGKRDEFVTALDAIWAIAFDRLSGDARTVLSILAFMSPDSILIDLFLPSDQSRLTDILQFCRSASSNMVLQGPSIETVVRPSHALQTCLDELVQKGLININGRQISLHRTVREGLAYANREWFRQCFSAAVSLMYDAFPQQIEGRPLSDSWAWCRVWIPHAVQLANQYDFLSKKRDDDEPPLVGIDSEEIMVKLLANCAWYLYEVADYEECLHVISMAKFAATDRFTNTYAHLLNTEGVIFIEQNKLIKARMSLEQCLNIRQDLFDENHVEMGNTYNNLCNLETAEGNLDVALEQIERACKIYASIGDAAGALLALATISMGRCQFLKHDYTKAYRQYQQAEGLLNKKVARNQYFTATLYYAYGNLSFAQEEYDAAAREYEKARHVMRSTNPVHPLVAACLYKLACIEFVKDHHTKAQNLLNKAYDIADVKSGGKTNGTVLRILWKKSEVLEGEQLSSGGEGARLAENCAYHQKIVAQDLGIDLSEFALDEYPERIYNKLVPGYFR